MNIFVLDQDIGACARYHADQHVVKMILESTQLLCTAINQHGGEAPYRSTHVKHPCTLWTGHSLANWRWLHCLGLALYEEYRYRFGTEREHRAGQVLRLLAPPDIPDLGLTEFAQAMPEKYRVPGNAVLAYRRFYIGDKSRFAKWTRRRPPKWYVEGLRQAVEK